MKEEVGQRGEKYEENVNRKGGKEKVGYEGRTNRGKGGKKEGGKEGNKDRSKKGR